mgnify:CR=1 FL=1
MNKPVLVVMAAGMGSRYGGMKQIDPVGPCGQVIVDYSLYDARRAGFETVIFVIKHEIEEAFKAAIGDRVSRVMDVKYAFQQLDELPEGYTIPEGPREALGYPARGAGRKALHHGPSPSSMPTTTTAPRRSRSSTITSPLTPTARSTTTAW